MRPWSFVLLVLLLEVGCSTVQHGDTQEATANVITVGPFLNAEATEHQARIQQCLNKADERSTVFRFVPGNYVLADVDGLRVPAHAALVMDGARFLLPNDIRKDGQAFVLDNVSDVSLHGGEIVGSRNAWDASVNVAGVRVYGHASNIRIVDLTCRDLSSNAVGVFGESDAAPIRDVSLVHVTGIDCCNEYVDYLLPNKGPAPGSDREDQGVVAFYYVDGWSVDACLFKNSHSDGTHFFHCRNGSFANCSVIGSRMGGYFLEGCENVLASGNLIRGNGSRGVTIERDSQFCVLASNLIAHSGREGLWSPDACSIIVTGNIFVENGQKDDQEMDCEIRLDETSEYATKTRDVRIEGNIFRTNARQTAAIYTGAGVGEIVVENNTFQGPGHVVFR